MKLILISINLRQHSLRFLIRSQAKNKSRFNTKDRENQKKIGILNQHE